MINNCRKNTVNKYIINQSKFKLQLIYISQETKYDVEQCLSCKSAYLYQQKVGY